MGKYNIKSKSDTISLAKENLIRAQPNVNAKYYTIQPTTENFHAECATENFDAKYAATQLATENLIAEFSTEKLNGKYFTTQSATENLDAKYFPTKHAKKGYNG